jgi:hypothetical protein
VEGIGKQIEAGHVFVDDFPHRELKRRRGHRRARGVRAPANFREQSPSVV